MRMNGRKGKREGERKEGRKERKKEGREIVFKLQTILGSGLRSNIFISLIF